MIFSGDYVVPNCEGDYYGFMTRRFTLTPDARARTGSTSRPLSRGSQSSTVPLTLVRSHVKR
jgi:hypothetical protein